MKRFGWWPFLLPIILAIGLRLPFLDREFVLEESYLVRAGKAIADSGYPIFYDGQQTPQKIFLARPPGSILALAASFKILKVSEVSTRLVPVLFFLGQLLLVIAFGLRLGPRPHQKMIAFLAGLLFAIHPYVLQNSTQVHYDGAIFSFFSTLYLLAALETIINKRNGWRDHARLGFLFFLAFAIKYDPTLMALLIVAVFALFHYRRFVPKLLLASFAAAVLFFGLFYLYNVAHGHPEGFLIPFQETGGIFKTTFIPKFTTFEISPRTRALWADNYYILIRFLSWLSIPTLLLSFYAFVRFLQEKSLRTNPTLVYLVLWIAVYCGVYIGMGWGGDYPRYFAPMLPPLFLLTSAVTVHDFNKLKRHSPKMVGGAVLVSGVTLILAHRANLLFLDRITGWVPSLQTPFFITLAIGLVSIAVSSRLKTALLPLLMTLLFLNLGQFTMQVIHDARSTFSLTNFYGSSGSRDAGNFLKKEFESKDATVFTFDPVAYYWDGRYYEYTSLAPLEDRHPQLLQALFSGEVTAIALPQVYVDELHRIAMENDRDFQHYLSENFQEHKNFGGEKGVEVWY